MRHSPQQKRGKRPARHPVRRGAGRRAAATTHPAASSRQGEAPKTAPLDGIPVNDVAGVAYSSMVSAAGVLGVSVDWLLTDRNAGCPAFAGGRVRKGDYLRWLLVKLHGGGSNGQAHPTLTDARRDLAVEQAIWQRMRTAERYGELISRERHEALVRRSLEAGLRFVAELPVRFAGELNPVNPELGARALRHIVEAIKERFRGEGKP